MNPLPSRIHARWKHSVVYSCTKHSSINLSFLFSFRCSDLAMFSSFDTVSSSKIPIFRSVFQRVKTSCVYYFKSRNIKSFQVCDLLPAFLPSFVCLQLLLFLRPGLMSISLVLKVYHSTFFYFLVLSFIISLERSAHHTKDLIVTPCISVYS